MESGALLLTATITPQAGVPNLRVTDPGQRRAEYLSSLAFAITLDPKVVTSIVFAENSGADLSDFKSLAERDARVQLLNLSPALFKLLGDGATWKRRSCSMPRGPRIRSSPQLACYGKRPDAISSTTLPK